MFKQDGINPQTAYIKTAPMQYVNKVGILQESGKYISRWGKRALISGGNKALSAIESQLCESLDSNGINWSKHIFIGECCNENIEIIIKKARDMEADIIIGVGGGKAIDSAKAAAEECGISLVCIPTIAATCAAASGISVVYYKSGEFEKDIYLTRTADLVLVDPVTITNAPVEYLQSGILDSISKWYESNAAIKSLKTPDVFTLTSVYTARLINEIMEKEASDAIEQVKEKKVNDTLLHVIDLNIYLAGVAQGMGQVSTRGAAAHSIHGGLSVLEESHKILHGFKVGYGIIVQLFMEGVELEKINKVVEFFRKLNLEPSLKGLKLPSDKDTMLAVARKAVKDPIMKRMPFFVDEDVVVKAMEEVEGNV